MAYDAFRGFFAINEWSERLGGTYYLSPDAAGWQPRGMGYSGLVEWSMSSALDRFARAP